MCKGGLNERTDYIRVNGSGYNFFNCYIIYYFKETRKFAIYNRYIVDTTITCDTEPVSVDEMRNRIHDIASCFPYFVYEHQGRVVGYAYVHQWKERAAYARTLETTVYLSPDAFHSGIGTTLMQHVIDECRSLGYRVLIACITAENTGSLEFHKSLGFTQVSFFHNVGEKFGRLLDVIDMELQL